MTVSIPGQFVHLRVGAFDQTPLPSYDLLLRRPFSIHQHQGRTLEILYKVVGRGTEILSKKLPHEELDLLGPLGQGFFLPPTGEEMKWEGEPLIVAGGMGIAPLLFLAKRIKSASPLVLIGAKTKKNIFGENEFKKMGIKTLVATEDGSRGFKGMVTELLKKYLSTINYKLLTIIYTCGPWEMLRKIAAISAEWKIPCQVSLEGQMACGVGACQGCVIKCWRAADFTSEKSKADRKEGEIVYKRICCDGPVFNSKQVVWQ